MSSALTIEDDGSSLAEAFVSIEARLRGERPARVVLADSSDASLAAAITAAKLLIPVIVSSNASNASTVNSRLIAELACGYTEPG